MLVIHTHTHTHTTPTAPPTHATLSISGNGAYIYDFTAYVPMPLRGKTSTLNISCDTDISSDNSTLRYDWVFRGAPIDSNSSNFYKNGNTLRITTADIWDVVGIFQCSVTNMAGSVTTNIQLLIDGMFHHHPRSWWHARPCTHTSLLR